MTQTADRRRMLHRKRREANEQFITSVESDLESLPDDIAFAEPGVRLEGESRVKDVRRGRLRRGDVQDGVGVISLVDVDGVLRWETGQGIRTREVSGRRRRRNRELGRRGQVVKQLKFRDLPRSRVGAALQALDAKLTPNLGLHNVTGQLRVAATDAQPVDSGRILLIVHGTFSHADNVLAGLKHTTPGRNLLKNARRHYDQVLAFNHPTLSVSPFLNAVELARLLNGTRAEIDIICHSRGGLVSRWWREVVDPVRTRKGKVIFVGSPVAGTSLAAPHRIRATLDLITNISKALSIGAKVGATAVPVAAPLFTAAAVLARLFSKVTGIVAKTPLPDAAVAAVPGLAAQSRDGANFEIDSLRNGNRIPAAGYFAIQSDFQPDAPGWRFWNYFNNIKGRLVNAGADIIFDDQPNDLVVDVASMTDFTESLKLPTGDDTRVLSFGTNDTVHHVNYFEQPDVVSKIRTWLQIPG